MAAHPMEAVAPRYEVAVEDRVLAPATVANEWPLAVEPFDRGHFGLIDRWAALGLPGSHQVARDLGLAVDHHGGASGQSVQVDMKPLAADAQLDAAMDQPFEPHAIGALRLLKELDGALLEHAGPHPPQHVLRAAALEDHTLNAVPRQEPGKQ